MGGHQGWKIRSRSGNLYAEILYVIFEVGYVICSFAAAAAAADCCNIVRAENEDTLLVENLNNWDWLRLTGAHKMTEEVNTWFNTKA